MKKLKKYLILIVILIIIIFLIFIFKNVIKKSKNGNNMDSQEIVDYILNINSYSAIVEIEVNSNKNTNKYIIKQEYGLENGMIQEVIEPKNLAGVKITKKDDKLTLENTTLSLSKFFENYTGLGQNCLDLNEFINNYKTDLNTSCEEENGEIIMRTSEKNENKYIKNKILYINKKELKPTKLLIQDDNQKTTIIIKYNKIELN